MALLRISPLAPRPPGNQFMRFPPLRGSPLHNGDLRGDIHRRLERESRKWGMNQKLIERSGVDRLAEPR
jgi:hypothetical protein